MERIQEIDKEIEALKNQMESVEGTETEVYTRIVGYYRSVRNWNRGKREEYGIRTTFNATDMDREPAAEAAAAMTDELFPEFGTSQDKLSSYMYFYRTSCPNCPPVKALLDDLAMRGEHINVDEAEGFEKARAWNICASPSVVFLDNEGGEITRAVNIEELRALNLLQTVNS